MNDDETKYVWVVSIDDYDWSEIKNVCSSEERAKEKWEEKRVKLLNQTKRTRRSLLKSYGYSLQTQLDYFAIYQYYHNLILDNIDVIEFYGERPVVQKHELI